MHFNRFDRFEPIWGSIQGDKRRGYAKDRLLRRKLWHKHPIATFRHYQLVENTFWRISPCGFSMVEEASRHEAESGAVDFGGHMLVTDRAAWFREGRCPQCGEMGKMVQLAPVCSAHGPYEFSALPEPVDPEPWLSEPEDVDRPIRMLPLRVEKMLAGEQSAAPLGALGPGDLVYNPERHMRGYVLSANQGQYWVRYKDGSEFWTSSSVLRRWRLPEE